MADIATEGESELAARMDYDEEATMALLKGLAPKARDVLSDLLYIDSSTKIPRPTDLVDLRAYNQITSRPWLLRSLKRTGSLWGKRIADVRIDGVPKNMVAMALLEPGDNIRLMFSRWDRHEYLGWENDFPITLVFPAGMSIPPRTFMIPSSSRLSDGHSVRTTIQATQRVPQKNRVIPRVLWNISTPAIEERSSHAVRRLLRNIRFMTDFIQCTSMYMVLGTEACLWEAANTEIPGFKEAYDAVIPGSYKADLMRYYILYRYGGVYVDDKCTIRYSLDSDVFDSILGGGGGDVDGSSRCDMFIGIIGWGGGVPEIAFMGARPGCPVMLKALVASLVNITNRRYGEDRLAITGSTMLRQVMKEGISDPVSRNYVTQVPPSPPETSSSDGGGGIGVNWVECWGDRVALLRIENCYEKMYHGKELVWHRQAIPFHDWPKQNYYWDLWKSKQVYTTGNPPTPYGVRISNFMSRTGLADVCIVIVGLLALLGVGFLLHNSPTASL